MKEILNTQDFKEVIKQNKPVLLDFYADWCGPCQTLMPTLETLSNKHKDDVVIAKVNVDKNSELSTHFKVRSIPSLFFIKDGNVVDYLNGLQTQKVLEEKIETLKNNAA